MAALTQRQLEFARCVGLRNMSLIDAYRAAGYSQNQSVKTQNDNASRLAQHSGVIAEIDRHNREADRAMTASVVSDKDRVLTEFRRVIDDGESDNVKVRAAESLGKTIPGLFKGEEAIDPPKSSDEIRKELAEYLAEYGISVDSLSDKAH